MIDKNTFIQRRALQLQMEAERMRKRGGLITGPMMLRAADIVSLKEAAEVAHTNGHRFLAWRLTTLIGELRAKPIPEEDAPTDQGQVT